MPNDIAITNDGRIFVTDELDNRIYVLFDSILWTKAGTTTLGNLVLGKNQDNTTQDLTLKDSYNLVVQSIKDTSSETEMNSDGKLTLKDGATLTLESG